MSKSTIETLNTTSDKEKISSTAKGCVEFKSWHLSWITYDGHTYRAWEPDNTCIYEGTDLNLACKALNNSTYDG